MTGKPLTAKSPSHGSPVAPCVASILLYSGWLEPDVRIGQSAEVLQWCAHALHLHVRRLEGPPLAHDGRNDHSVVPGAQQLLLFAGVVDRDAQRVHCFKVGLLGWVPAVVLLVDPSQGLACLSVYSGCSFSSVEISLGSTVFR